MTSTRRRRGRQSAGPSSAAVIAWCVSGDPQLRSALTYATVLALHTRGRRFSRLTDYQLLLVIFTGGMLTIAVVGVCFLALSP